MEASEDFMRALRRRCDEVKAVLIFDEIQVSYMCAQLRARRSLLMMMNVPSVA